jgi:hypothetical protein
MIVMHRSMTPRAPQCSCIKPGRQERQNIHDVQAYR